jgi:uncharacterized RmlC-like cupin family protein
MSQKVAQAALREDRSLAAPFVGGLWAAIRSADGPCPASQDYQHLPGVFDPAWLQTLPLPIGKNRPTRQTVSLGKAMHFERLSDEAALKNAYDSQPRTKIYESIETRSGGWTAEATRYLMKLAGCDVVCSVYESQAGDKTLGPHKDRWYGAIVQIHGAKEWQLGEDVEREQTTVVAEAGDLLLVPQGLLHDVSTPNYSVHMTVAILVDGYDWMKPEINAGRIVPIDTGA